MEIVQVVITRTEENKLKITTHSRKEVIFSEEYDDPVLFRHVLEDLIDELAAVS